MKTVFSEEDGTRRRKQITYAKQRGDAAREQRGVRTKHRPQNPLKGAPRLVQGNGKGKKEEEKELCAAWLIALARLPIHRDLASPLAPFLSVSLPFRFFFD